MITLKLGVKMKVKIKVPVNKIEKEDNCEKIFEFLKKDKDNAYTVQGLMIEIHGVKESQIHGKSFSERDKKLNTMYSRITSCLKKLERSGKVKSTKHERAYIYWFNPEYRKFKFS